MIEIVKGDIGRKLYNHITGCWLEILDVKDVDSWQYPIVLEDGGHCQADGKICESNVINEYHWEIPLITEPPKPSRRKKVIKWINCYADGSVKAFDSKDGADLYLGKIRVDCITIQFEINCN